MSRITDTDLAHRFGTPTYVYDADLIRTRCHRLKAAFAGAPVELLYAVKANDNPHVLDLIRREGLGFDTVSYEEALLGLRVGQPAERIWYTENNMTDEEMQEALDAGVYLNIGSYTRLEAFCRLSHRQRTCSIRVNPAIGDGHHAKVDTGNRDSKFGIRLDLIPAAVDLAAAHGVRITGLHLHIGSGIQHPANLIAAMDRLLETAARIPTLERINFGGGFPIPYREGEAEFALEAFAELARTRFTKPGITYFFEPGRWIVAPAGHLLTRVNTVKDQGRVTFLGTDTGFNHLLRPALYEAYHAVENASRPAAAATTVYTIAGNICETGDILAEDRRLPETALGDLLRIRDTGAYGMTMASQYNRRPLPAEVLLEAGVPRLIRPRASAEAVVASLLTETGYPA